MNTKTVENKNFIQYLKRFPKTLSVCNVTPTSKHKYQVSVFSYSCPKSQCLYIFKNLCVDCFQYRLSSVWSYIFFLNGPDKKPKQNGSKIKRHSQQQKAKSVPRRTAVSERKLARLHCLLYFLLFDRLRPAVLFFLNWTVCLFLKGSPI